MAIYALSPYTKAGKTLFPHNTYYTDDYARSHCPWYLTDHVYKDESGKVCRVYRLHSHEPRTFADFMAYDIICPECGQRMQPIENALNYHDLALYACRNCNKK